MICAQVNEADRRACQPEDPPVATLAAHRRSLQEAHLAHKAPAQRIVHAVDAWVEGQARLYIVAASTAPKLQQQGRRQGQWEGEGNQALAAEVRLGQFRDRRPVMTTKMNVRCSKPQVWPVGIGGRTGCWRVPRSTGRSAPLHTKPVSLDPSEGQRQ